MLQNEKNPHDHARSYTIKKRKPIFLYTHDHDTRTITNGTRIFQHDWLVNNNFDTIVS